MEYIIAPYVILLLILTHFIIKDALSKFCLYSFIIYWGISLFITCFHPMGMGDVAPKTHMLLMLAMLGFCSGFFCFNYYIDNKAYTASNTELLKNTRKYCSSTFFNVFYILSTIFLLNFAVRALVLAEVNGGTIEYAEREELVFQGNKYAQMFMDFIITPLSFVTFTFLGINLLKPSRKLWKFYTTAPLFTVSYLIIAGGRSIFVIGAMIVMIVMVSMKVYRSKYNISLKYILIGIPVVLVLMLAMAAQTNYRSKGKYELDDKALKESIEAMAESFYTYSVIPVKMLDHALEIDLPEKFGTFNLGRATFAGTDFLLCRGIGHITGHTPKSTMEIVYYCQENWVQILPKSHLGYNYCYTATFYNYLDFGFIGVFIMPFVFSFLFRFFVIKYQQYKSLPDLLILSFGYFMMLMSLFNGYFIKPWTLIYCIVLIIWSEYNHPIFKHYKIKKIFPWKKVTIKLFTR